MKKLQLFLLGLLTMSLLACGGGGAISSSRISGRVLDIKTGAPTTTATAVQSTSATANTSLVDGSFLVGAQTGATQLIVSAPSLLGYPVFTYQFQPLNLAQNDVGDLWVGPEQISVTGVVQNAADNTPIANAVVRFGGQFATSDSSGTFTIQHVAYYSADTSSFDGIAGSVDATNYLSNQFTTGGIAATGGAVNVGVVLMTPAGDSTPPPSPYNIWGNITSPSVSANGTIVTLKDSGGTVVRRFTVGSNARYQFWVTAGQYSIEYANGTHTAPTQNVTLNNNSDVIQRDAVLN